MPLSDPHRGELGPRLRGGELKALTWPDVDIERSIVSVRRSYDRDTGRIKQTKTGDKGMRRFASGSGSRSPSSL